MMVKAYVNNIYFATWISLIVVNGLVSHAAAASLDYYGLEWWQIEEQTANSTLTGTPQYKPGAFVSFSETGAASALTLNNPAFGQLAFIDVAGDGTAWQLDASEYTNKAALFNAFPVNSTYTIAITGGTMDGSTLEIAVGEEKFTNDLPYLTGNTFSELHGIHPNSDFTFEPNMIFMENNASIWASDVNVDNPFWVAYVDDTTSGTIPGGTFDQGSTYDVFLVEDKFGVFEMQTDGSTLGTRFTSITVIEDVSPVPIPAAAWLFGTGLAGLGFFRRKIKVMQT